MEEFEDAISVEPREVHRDSKNKITWVITSDSEYVVLGMTEWLPTWKVSHTCYSGPPFRLIYLNRATDGATHRGRDQRISISFRSSTRLLSATNRHTVFESPSGVSTVLTTNLPMNLPGLLRKVIQSNQFSFRFEYVHLAQFSPIIDICISQANVFVV